LEKVKKLSVELEKRVEEFSSEIADLRKKSKQIEELKSLNESLLNYAMTDAEIEIVGEIGGKGLTYCKRVKYLEKAWILVQKSNCYYWID